MLSDSIVTIDKYGKFLVVEDKDVMILPSFELNLSRDEYKADVDYHCFEFGDEYYFTQIDQKLTLTPLKYIGTYDSALGLSVPFIGLHGMYEILNGSRDYSDWIKKAKFLNIQTLGICEKNTLAGTLKFQIKCKDKGIKPIIGEQIVVKDDEDLFQFKCYVKDERGWNSLLLINKEINVINRGFIKREAFVKLTDGLFVVVDLKYTPHAKILPYELNIPELYYQIDSVEFTNDSKDKEYLLNLKAFMSQKRIRPIYINDAYYIDKGDYDVKNMLNSIANARDFKSENQYFKTVEENFYLFSSLFEEEDDRCLDLFELSINNLIKLVDRCNFEISTGIKLLPKYIMTEEEVKNYGDRDSMFWALIQDGLDMKVVSPGKDLDMYLERIEEEYPVISSVTSEYGDGIDYFLILWDIIRYCKENDILVGLGRGSSSGSIVSYLLDITKLDPFDYGLLFSRFLNSGRVENGALPDIDTDFESNRRDEIKHYMERKYDKGHVCSVGTYTTLQLKAALKDIARLRNIEYGTVNYISQLLDIEDGNWEDIFMTCFHKKQVKDFVLRYPDVIEDIRLILKQPKSNSIHACATIITPPDKEIFQYFPVRLETKNGEDLIVSEWEGIELEMAGFLKEDILGIKQLDKYKFIINLIKKQTDKDIDIYSLPLNDVNVYEFFQKGNNGDIFHFGSRGLTKYCTEVMPRNIYELIDVISLYRPGAMDVNAHNEYVLRKFGDRDVTYKWGTKDILKNTYGLIIYQEQVMEIVQTLGNFDLVTADDVRRAMGKKKKDVLEQYREKFIDTILEKGCPEDEAEEIWHELEVHSGYSFNKSHAAAYAITGYIGQWLKYHYPLQYWSAAFEFDNPDPKKSNITRYISEIRRTDNFIKLAPLNVNESGQTFTSNIQKMELYWSISKVKQLGDVALSAIISEREKNDIFFDLEDFLSRVKKKEVNKAIVINLILSGAFDEIEGIKSAGERKGLIDKYYNYPGNKRDKDDIFKGDYEDYWWQIKQKEISGFGEINYQKVIQKHTKFFKEYTGGIGLQSASNNKEVVVIGIITNVDIKTNKRDEEFCNIILDCNNEIVNVTIWNDTFSHLDRNQINIGNIFTMNGKVSAYRHPKSVQSVEKTEIYLI